MTTATITQNAKTELAKLFQLTVQKGQRLQMFSDYLDEIWHLMLEDPETYNEFCLQSCGRKITHVDSSIPGASGYGLISWIPEYENAFGKLAKEWFMDINGNIDLDVYSRYQTEGTVVAAWRCEPSGSGTGGDDDYCGSNTKR